MVNYKEKKITDKNIEAEIINIIKGNTEKTGDYIDIDQQISDYFDSWNHIYLIMELEEFFDISIWDEDAEKMNSVKDCCDILKDKYLICMDF